MENYTDYFGFDLGDGESAVAWLRKGSRTDPKMIELRGRKSFLSVLGVDPNRGVLIGEEACHAMGLDSLETRFKSRYLTDREGSSRSIERFARAVYENLLADGRIEDEETACFFVGCPSGWPETVREDYRKLFLRAGMKHVQVVSESRAAFMYARESGELRVSDDLLTLPTLIVDAGSSTTDFTFVADLAEESLSTCDFGESALGGGLLDRLLLEKNVDRCPEREALRGVFRRFPQYYARAELEARKVKEMFFTQQARGETSCAESSVKIYAGITPITLDVSASDADMRELLSRPLEELGGCSFEEGYVRSLRRAHELLRDRLPDTVLLTGGASRMGFLEVHCREVFPGAQVLRGLEPEYAIARGLCHALRIDQKTQGFSEAVSRLIQSEELEDLVMSELPALFEGVSGPLVDKLITDVAPKTFERWKQGSLRTIDDISAALTERVQEMMRGEELSECLRPAVAEWIARLRPQIERLTDPICDEYELPRTSLRLPDELSIQTSSLSLETAQLMDTGSIKALIDVVVAALIAALLGGSGIALLAAGTPGILAGFLIGLLAAVVGTQTAEKLLRKAELPVKLRRLFPSSQFARGLKSKRDSIERAVYAQLTKGLEPPTEETRRMVKTIAESIESQLTAMMRRATLRIH